MPFLGTTGGGSVKQYGGQANLGYFIKNSLRFRASNSATLSRTPSVSGNRKVWTWSAWVKRGALDSGATDRVLFSSPSQSGNDGIAAIYFDSDQLHTYYDTSGANPYGPIGPALYRDPAAWMHIVWAVDAANTIHYVYVNNTLVSTDAAFYPPNYDYSMNRSGYTHYFGTQAWGPNDYWDGYMAEVNFVDGQALTPSSFGKTDAATNQWIPKKFAGTYGTNGFYLKFADTSAATAAAIGKDSSGNGNNWTPSGISVTSGITCDAMTDSPTLSAAASNYCVMNPLDGQGTATLTDGNLTIASSGATHRNRKATFMLPSTGKWYWELTTTATCSVSVILGWGLQTTSAPTNSSAGETGSFMAQNDANQDIWNQSTNVISTGSAVAANAIRQVAYDADTGKIWFGINNVWYSSTDLTSGNPSAGTNQCITLSAGNYFPAITPYNMTANVNFGQQPFSYTPPTGFKSLNTYNLP